MKEAPGRIHILLWSVVGKWFDDHPGAAGFECFKYSLCCTNRIAHVVQAIKTGDQIKVVPRKFSGICRNKGDIV